MQTHIDIHQKEERTGVPLSRITMGETGCVEEIDPASPLGERLGDLGVTPGARLLCERVSLFGDPVAYRILPAAAGTALEQAGAGTVIALRRQDAAAIRVSVQEREGEP